MNIARAFAERVAENVVKLVQVRLAGVCDREIERSSIVVVKLDGCYLHLGFGSRRRGGIAGHNDLSLDGLDLGEGLPRRF